MEEKPRSLPGDAHLHAPLPYRVVLRVVIDQDKPPQRIEAHVTAYSLYEAMYSAILSELGRIENVDCEIEEIGPDVPAFAVLMAARVMEAVRASR